MVLVFGFASASAAPNGRPLVIESTASAMPAEMNLFVMFFIFLRFPLPISFFLFVLFNGGCPFGTPFNTRNDAGVARGFKIFSVNHQAASWSLSRRKSYRQVRPTGSRKLVGDFLVFHWRQTPKF